jgi:hypothetical protein
LTVTESVMLCAEAEYVTEVSLASVVVAQLVEQEARVVVALPEEEAEAGKGVRLLMT